MKKFYRNRYSSFLSTLAGKKNERQEEENARKEAEMKKKEKIRLKAIGDTNEIKSKFMEARPQVPTADEMAMIEMQAKAVLVVGNQVVKRKPMEVLMPIESPGLGPSTQSDMQKRQLRSSRSNRRSLSNTGMGQMNSIGKIYQNGKKPKRTGSRSSNRSKGGDSGLPPLSIKK
jgi:hypothetical protein